MVETAANQLEEWKQCITLIDKFEDRLDATRRYGFTFVAGLLTANAFLGEVSGTLIPLSVKIAVLWVAAFLPLVLRVLDRNYQSFQSTIGKRARVLERSLGMALELSIIDRYVKLRMWRFILAVYYGFEVMVLLLGLAIVWGYAELEVLAVIGPLIAIVSIYSLEPHLQKSDKQIEPSEQAGR